MDDVKDREGYPLTADHGGSFVIVERPGLTAGRVMGYRGLIRSITRDRNGPLIEISEWRAGRFTGRKNLARPEHCRAIRAPEGLRDEQARVARVLTRVREKE